MSNAVPPIMKSMHHQVGLNSFLDVCSLTLLSTALEVFCDVFKNRTEYNGTELDLNVIKDHRY